MKDAIGKQKHNCVSNSAFSALGVQTIKHILHDTTRSKPVYFTELGLIFRTWSY